jgi:DNA-binding MarR family transcriptional regulator
VEYSGNELEDLFRTISRMQHNCVRREFERRGIDSAFRTPILFVLRDSSENMAASQKEIADRLGLSTSTVAVSIKRLEKAGLLHKIADETDLRRNLITLTEKGRQYADEAQTVFERVDRGMFNDLSHDERAQLKKLFLRIVANLDTMKKNPPQDFGEEKTD